jgi:hypothetical protein
MWSFNRIDLCWPEEVISFAEYLNVEPYIARKIVKLRFLHVRCPAYEEIERKLVHAHASILRAASSLQDLIVTDYCLHSLACMGPAHLLKPSLCRLVLDFLLLM